MVLRRKDALNAHAMRRMRLLADFQERLGCLMTIEAKGKDELARSDYSELFWSAIEKMLSHLCSSGDLPRYDGAAIWLLQSHLDHGLLAILHSKVASAPTSELGNRLSLPSDLSYLREAQIFSSNGSSSSVVDGEDLAIWPPSASTRAVLPIRSHQRTEALLALWAGRLPMASDNSEEAFLRALSGLCSAAYRHLEYVRHSRARQELDQLLQTDSLEDVLARAAEVLGANLRAQGCEILFRANPADRHLRLVASHGFDPTILESGYPVGVGLTGRVAESSYTVRIDDVQAHLQEFDHDLLARLEKAHGATIHSWMAVPIGPPLHNYGVVKVVNKAALAAWFNEDDVALAFELALLLRVIIEKFVAEAQSQREAQRARSEAETARAAQRAAEETTLLRQQDLMTLMHSLQGPLTSVIGSLSYLKGRGIPPAASELLENARDLAEDALLLCVGTTMGFSLEEGRKPSLSAAPVDVRLELQRLSRRLARSNSRPDLEFRLQPSDSPLISTINHGLLLAVFFSLLTNALKYSDPRSKVDIGLSCTADLIIVRITTVGEPILPEEREVIFEKFRRGRAVSGGRYHTGTGLGLWVARQLARSVGGDLVVELDAERPRRSMFELTIPRVVRDVPGAEGAQR